MKRVASKRARRESLACLAFFCHAFLLYSQESLPVFPTPKSEEWPPLGEMLPLRPFSLQDPAKQAMPFRFRGEQVLQGQETTLVHGAVESDQFLLLADRITYNAGAGTLEAEGHIRLEAPDVRMRCERLRMDWHTRSGEAWFVEVELPPSWQLKSNHVTFLDQLTFWHFEKVDLTPCPDPRTGWSARLSDLKLEVEGFAKFKHLRLMVGGVPMLYFPWAMYPAKYKRSSGLLFPEIGFSDRDGFTYRQGYYQVLGDRADLTLQPKLFTKRGVLWGGECRWHPELTHSGYFGGNFIRPKASERLSDDMPKTRYRYHFRELWQREDGWQLMADINQASDALLDVDYGNSLSTFGGNAYNSALFVGKNFSWGSFNLTSLETRTFFSKDDPFYTPNFPASMVRQALPTLQWRAFPVPLGQFYLDGGLQLSRFAYKLDLGSAGRQPKYPWYRGDASLRLHGRLGQWGPFRSDLQLGGRFTFYSASLKNAVFDSKQKEDMPEGANPNLDPFRVEGPSLYRWLGSSCLQLSGPQMGRTYEKLKLFDYSGDLKHVMDPFIAFTVNTRSDKTPRIPRFDEIDARPGVGGSVDGERSVEIGLKQHILGRQNKGFAFADIVRWRISSRYHSAPILLSDGRIKKGWASLDNDIDVDNDRLRISFRRSAEMGSLDADNSLSAEYHSKSGDRFGLAFFSTGINRFLVRQRGIQIGGLHRFDNDRWRLEYQGSYDFKQSTLAFGQIGLSYVTPCIATRLRFCHVLQPAESKVRNNCVELTFTLKELGDVLPLTKWF